MDASPKQFIVCRQGTKLRAHLECFPFPTSQLDMSFPRGASGEIFARVTQVHEVAFNAKIKSYFFQRWRPRIAGKLRVEFSTCQRLRCSSGQRQVPGDLNRAFIFFLRCLANCRNIILSTTVVVKLPNFQGKAPLRHRFSGMLCYHEHEHGPIVRLRASGEVNSAGPKRLFRQRLLFVAQPAGIGTTVGWPSPSFSPTSPRADRLRRCQRQGASPAVPLHCDLHKQRETEVGMGFERLI